MKAPDGPPWGEFPNKRIICKDGQQLSRVPGKGYSQIYQEMLGIEPQTFGMYSMCSATELLPPLRNLS